MPCKLRRKLKHRYVSTVTLTLLAIFLLGVACITDSRKKSGNSGTSNAPRNSNAAAAGEKFRASLQPGITIPNKDDEVGWRVLSEYGAVLVARGGAVPPPLIVFPDGKSVSDWQGSVKTMRTDFGGTSIELQAPAMTALMEARTEAKAAGLNISPRDNDAGRRSYEDTVSLWESRVNPGLDHWAQDGRLPQTDAARIRALSPRDQIPEILRLENEGLYFNRDFSRSILSSVAAPGTSQHISMLAFDVKEHEDADVRSILARHGWFQTVASDTPHFTFLGVTEDQLPTLGLKKQTASGRTVWIPKLD